MHLIGSNFYNALPHKSGGKSFRVDVGQ